MSDTQAEAKVILIMRCNDCGAELNRTNPLNPRDVASARLFSAFAGGKCPCGCRSTFSDLNINTRIEEIPA